MKNIFILLLGSLLVACGGGSDTSYGERPAHQSNQNQGTWNGGGSSNNGNSSQNPTPTEPEVNNETVTGYYVGSTENQLDLEILALENGEFWGLYINPVNTEILVGFIQGNLQVAGKVVTSSDFKFFSLLGKSLYSGTVSATTETKKYLNGEFQYLPSNKISFNTTYQTTSFAVDNMDTLEGQYTGKLGSLDLTENAEITIQKMLPHTTNIRQITGITESECKFTGQMQLSSSKTYYDVELKFSNSPCLLVNQTAKGIIRYEQNTQQIKLLSVNTNGNNGIAFVGVKSNTEQ